MNLGLGTIVNTYFYQEKDGIEQVKAHINNLEPQLVVVVLQIGRSSSHGLAFHKKRHMGCNDQPFSFPSVE